jgi:hypothetical protein
MNPNEIWQVDVGGQVYEASLAELTQWIAEGSLLPQDRVRRGNLRWLDAIKVPVLYGFFNAKDLGITLPPLVTTATNTEAAPPAAETVQMQTENFPSPATVFSPTQPPAPNQFSGQNEFDGQNQFNSPNQFNGQNQFDAPNQQSQFTAPNQFSPQTTFAPTPVSQQTYQAAPQDFQPDFAPPMPAANVCLIHPENEPSYYCDGCANLFCKGCPTSYGGTVKICPMCGAMCKPLAVVQEQQKKAVQFHHDITQGFGFDDFGKALAYPFKYKVSLIVGAIMFMFFSISQSSAGFGGVWMLGASLFCFMLANMLTFGVLANTVENMSQGKLTENFMPTFDDFNIWDDVVQPFFLSIGVYLSSFGLLIVILVFGIVFMSNRAAATQGDHLADMSKQIQENKEARDDGRILPDGTIVPPLDQLTPEQRQAVNDNDIEKLQEMFNESRKANLESVVGKTKETRDKEWQQMKSDFATIGIPLLLLSFVALLWGIFYFPIACAVSGYTRSFAATVNPLVGLDTIKRMGFDYVKIFAMFLILSVASYLVSLILGVIFSAFDMPGVGNMPAKAIGSLFTFYFSVVFALVLGYAMYKNSAKLNLYRS